MSQEQVRDILKKLRDRIARLEAISSALPGTTTSRQGRYRGETIIHLAFARGWLGKALGSLGEATPYPQSDNPDSPVIEPPAYNRPVVVSERYPDIEAALQPKELVAWIKQLRLDIQATLTYLDSYLFSEHPPGFDRYIALSKTALEAARLMLGEELGFLGGH